MMPVVDLTPTPLDMASIATTGIPAAQPAGLATCTEKMSTISLDEVDAVSNGKRQETQPAAPSLLTIPPSVVAASTPAPAPLPSAQSKLDAILQLIDRKGLKGTAMRLPHVSTMRVTTQKRFPSEHPFKIRIGTLPNNGGDVVAFLGPTPKNPEHAPTLLVATHSYALPSTKWDKIPFVEPFQQLWNKTT
jgi:hypothetical protein